MDVPRLGGRLDWRERLGVTGGDRIVIWVVVIALAARLAAMVWMPVVPEEAYYWLYSEHPALSYFDHPPMVAWVIGAGTAVFGPTEFGVRVMGNLMGVGAAWWMWVVGRTWFSRREGILSAALVLVLPVYYATGLVATMDSAMLFFWTMSLSAVSAALRGGRWWTWYWAGASIGLTMLSKYTGVFLGLGTVLAILGRREWRRHLLNPHAYAGGILAWVVFSPVLAWNSQHEWASFRFQFKERWEDRPVEPMHVVTFVLGQVLVLTPVVMAGMIGMALGLKGRWRRALSARWVFALSFSVPLLAQMAWKSVWYTIHINWTLPGYLSVIPLACGWMVAVDRGRLMRGIRAKPWGGMTRATVGVCAAGVSVAALFATQFAPTTSLVPALQDWRTLAQVVMDHREAMKQKGAEGVFVAGDGRYRLAALLAFYCTQIDEDERASQYVTSQWLIDGPGLGFRYWSDEEDWKGRDCVWLDDRRPRAGESEEATRERTGEGRELGKSFESVEWVEDPRLKTIGEGRYRVALCRGYLGIEPERKRKGKAASRPKADKAE